MTKCPKCREDFFHPHLFFLKGKTHDDVEFEYATCSCPHCGVCVGTLAL